MPEPLSPEQQSVVDYTGTDLFVSACPGAGKTHTVVERFIARCQELPKNRGVAIVSFSRVAATEVRKRCHERGLSHLLSFPHFVGTLDSFFIRYLYLPLAQARSAHRVRVLDSWKAIDACVQLTGSKSVQGKGVPLDAFSYDGQQVRFDSRRLKGEFTVWRNQIQENLADWEKAAKARRDGLNRAGLRTCDDMRVAVAKTLSSRKWDFVLRALAARFCEIIVDEAQDCDESQISALETIRNAGIRLVLVADVDQAIYEFRKASPAILMRLAETLHPLPMRGNRRSAPAICATANSLVMAERANIQSVGETKDCSWPVRVIPYEPGAESEAGIDFCKNADDLGCRDKLLIAHRRSIALKAAGLAAASQTSKGTSADLLQKAFLLARGGMDAKTRALALQDVEIILLRRLRAEAEDQTIEDICLQEGIERRWLRASAVTLIRTLNKLIGNRAKITVGEAVTLARTAAERISPPLGRKWKRPPTTIFKTTAKKAARSFTLAGNLANPLDAVVSTVHGVKGEDADAVLFVISNELEAAKDLLAAWRSRAANHEGKRVAYVGITRARRLLGIAVPVALTGELIALLQERGVDLEEAPVCKRRKGPRHRTISISSARSSGE